jgi:hypothetical protein
MILQSLEQQPDQKPAIGEVAGRELPTQEKIVARSAVQRVPTMRDHQAAVEQMRYQLYLLDRSQHRKSIEDYIADMLEHPTTEAPV